MEQKSNGVTDMTKGSAYRLILTFTGPLLVGNIFQQLYNMVDSIVVGNFIGDKALAAVGTGFPIIFMMVSLFMGVGTGATIIISQFYGARDIENVSNTVNTIYNAMFIGAVPLTAVGILISGPLLRVMGVPDDGTLAMARVYMVTVFFGMIGTLGFNANAGILQGLGDSRTSLLFLSIATVVNIVLDLVFTLGGMGVFGVALATVTAQICSWLFGIYYINRHYSFLHIRPLRNRFHMSLFKKAMKLGIPSGIQQVLFSVGIMVMQSLVNSYGSAFMAGFNGANKIDTFAFLPIQSISTAVTTYVGQNVGAARLDRVKHGVRASLVLSVAGSVLIGAVLYPLSPYLMRMFNQKPDVIQAGVSYLHCVLPFYFLLALLFIYSSVLRGAGEMIIPMIASFISLWFARVPIAYLIAQVWGRDYIYLSYAVGWFLGAVLVYISYRRGRWKNKQIIVPADSGAAPDPG